MAGSILVDGKKEREEEHDARSLADRADGECVGDGDGQGLSRVSAPKDAR
jgi:hypothetical protein